MFNAEKSKGLGMWACRLIRLARHRKWALPQSQNYRVNGAEYCLADTKSQTTTALQISLKFTKPNVEATDAARLYRAASVWTAGLGAATGNHFG